MEKKLKVSHVRIQINFLEASPCPDRLGSAE